MIDNLPHKGKALLGPLNQWCLSFEDLHTAIQDAEKRLRPWADQETILYSKARRERLSIVEVLAALKLKIPVALLAEHWTEAENLKRLKVLGRCINISAAYSPSTAAKLPAPKHHPDTRLILFTSGSTSQPKAVQLSEKNLRANHKAVIESLKFNQVTEQHLFLNLSYSFGFTGQLIPGLVCGATTRLHNDAFSLRAPLEDGTLKGMISGVPSQLNLLAKLCRIPCPGVSDVVAAGAFLPPALRVRLAECFPKARLSSNYGQTEASPRILSISSDLPDFFSSAVGRPVSGIKVKISSKGELLAKGPQVMLGYLGDSTSTESKIQNDWLYTGDLASQDSNGNILIHGRTDHQIKIAGERINPLEIEKSIQESFGKTECAVFSSVNSSGENYLCLVIKKEPHLPEPINIRKTIASILSVQKIPKAIFFAKELPKNDNGKLKRNDLKALTSTWEKI